MKIENPSKLESVLRPSRLRAWRPILCLSSGRDTNSVSASSRSPSPLQCRHPWRCCRSPPPPRPRPPRSRTSAPALPPRCCFCASRPTPPPFPPAPARSPQATRRPSTVARRCPRPAAPTRRRSATSRGSDRGWASAAAASGCLPRRPRWRWRSARCRRARPASASTRPWSCSAPTCPRRSASPSSSATRSCWWPAAPCTWRCSTVGSSRWHTASGRGTAGPGCRPPTTTASTSSSPTSPSRSPWTPCSSRSTPTTTSSAPLASRSASGRPSRRLLRCDQKLNILFIHHKNSAVLRVDACILCLD